MTFHRTKKVVGRRDYPCDTCSRKIVRGETHHYDVGRYDDFYTSRTCRQCAAAWAWHAIVCDAWPDPCDLVECLADLATEIDGAVAAAWLEGIRRKWPLGWPVPHAVDNTTPPVEVVPSSTGIAATGHAATSDKPSDADAPQASGNAPGGAV